MAWDGVERRSVNDVSLLADDIRALNKTITEMHAQNLAGTVVRDRDVDTRLSQMADAIHGLALAVQAGDSKVATDIAVHIASAHHAGTLERLNDHETRLIDHSAEIGKLKQRIGTDEGRREGLETRSARHYDRWGLVLAVCAALIAAAASLLGSWWQAAATFLTGGPKTP